MPMNEIFVLNENSTRKYHPYTLKLQRYRSNIRKNDFSIRIIHIWNSLPLDFVESHSQQEFLTKLKKYDLSKHLLGPL